MAQNQIRGGQIRSGTIIDEQIAENAEIALSKIATGTALNDRVVDLETDSVVVREVPSGSVNGSNVTFTLANTPVSGSEQVYLNGLLQDPGADNSYTISGAVITFLSAPFSGDEIHVTYATGSYSVTPSASSGSSSTVDFGLLLAGDDSVTMGTQYTLAIRDDNKLFAWGYNSRGNLGLGDSVNRLSPVLVNNSSWSKIATSSWWDAGSSEEYFCLGIQTDGSLWSWGSNTFGQLGDGTTTQRLSPVRIGNDTWSVVACGTYHSMGIKTNGTLWAWGHSGASNRLGISTASAVTSPVQIGSATNWVRVSCGNASTWALKSDGTLWSWGYNAYGQLGTGNTTDRSAGPVQVGSDTNWSSVCVGFYHTMALKTNGTLWACGLNNYSGGILGDGTTTQRNSLIQIGSDTNWSKIQTKQYHNAAIKTDGSLWTWGWNQRGQIGDATSFFSNSSNKASPFRVGTGTDWARVACGQTNTAGIKSDGTLYHWGFGDNGALGQGNTTQRISPAKAQVNLKS